MKILHIDCSPRDVSHSRKMSADIVVRLLAFAPGASIIRRDLGREPVPHADAGYANALSSPASLDAEQALTATQLSEQLIREVEDADALVIGTPVNNFTVPSNLKAWIDQVLRVRRTIGTAPTGEKIGLLQDKPVYVGIASGGVFTGEHAKQPDFLTPYLRAAFACIGLKSLRFLALQGTAFRDDEQLRAERIALVASLDMAGK
ncbi:MULTISPECIES: FMN-dependent NADH-azoreductase [Pandoraea]|uniref:FMN-dependent NADH-azoreductase n=1 Tax=Pandoraea TaxID=93217 RepID=UPI0003C74F53|nr:MULTISPECIES: NAD(P)H-dependent oxidoreductase [Pandoraea]AHB04892.1 FMN-dependent NADH-azoreductase [Pandoraea pnomenusa 3kgm]AHB74737.1 FMN-dependent NADH-azoreductase [Pandoraea pnomenusa]AHN76919.1 FMN-dependent NADH-azoreductase [Pandoraea pnomenusa]MBN9094257.1 NAD(P)H-dependent oxidoreductase [Pandoraea pnomenusa]QDH60935.1 flavodoxin family protein [Pandoraea pnomenusa]